MLLHWRSGWAWSGLEHSHPGVRGGRTAFRSPQHLKRYNGGNDDDEDDDEAVNEDGGDSDDVMTTMLMMMVFMIFLGSEGVLPFFIRKCEASQSNAKYSNIKLKKTNFSFVLHLLEFGIAFLYAVFLRRYICHSTAGNVKPVSQKLNTTWNKRRRLKTGVWNKIVQSLWILMQSWCLTKMWRYVLWQHVQSGRNAM